MSGVIDLAAERARRHLPPVDVPRLLVPIPNPGLAKGDRVRITGTAHVGWISDHRFIRNRQTGENVLYLSVRVNGVAYFVAARDVEPLRPRAAQ